MKEIPKYALRAYGLLYTKFKAEETFAQDSLNWLVSSAMKKKIFAVLLDAGWITKVSKRTYKCATPDAIFSSLFEFKVPEILRSAKKKYYYTGMSAVEIWSDFTYMQRGWEHSPYFITIKDEDVEYWKRFLSVHGVPFFIQEGTFIGEFVILNPEKKISFDIHEGKPVEVLEKVIAFCEQNSLFEYPLEYITKKFKLATKKVST